MVLKTVHPKVLCLLSDLVKDQGLDTKEEKLNLTVKTIEYISTNGNSLLLMRKKMRKNELS